MRRKIIGILVCMLLVGTVLPVIGTTNDNKTSRQVSSDYDNFIQQIIDAGGSRTDWSEEVKLLASDGAEEDWFGCRVSIDGDSAIIGSPYDDDNGDKSGSAYVFTRTGTTWTQQAKLLASDGAAEDHFGHSVSIDGNYALIGAPLDNNLGLYSGSAYVFVKNGGNQPPNAPMITGETNGKVGEEYCWNISSVDPDGDDIMYIIEWGDGETTETECYPSGEEVEVCHTYNNQGTYTIKVKAKECPNGLVGPESTFTIIITKKTRAITSPFQNIFERFPNLFPILRLLLQRLGLQ